MIDAEYFARALWGRNQPSEPDAARLTKAKQVAEKFGVKWTDVEALKASAVLQTERVIERPIEKSPIAAKRLRRRLRTGD